MTRHHYNKQDDLRIRPCLCCKNDFESEWIGNRLCPVCAGWDGAAITANLINEDARNNKQKGAV